MHKPLHECQTREEINEWMSRVCDVWNGDEFLEALKRMEEIAELRGARKMQVAAAWETPDLPDEVPSADFTTGFLQGDTAKKKAILALNPAAVIQAEGLYAVGRMSMPDVQQEQRRINKKMRDQVEKLRAEGESNG